MKILKLIILVAMSTFFVLACDVNQSGESFEKEKPAVKNLTLNETPKFNAGKYSWEKPGGHAHKVVISFQGSFFSSNPDGVRPIPDERCAAPALLDTQAGEGEIQPLGPFSFHSTFCIDLTDLAPPLGGDGQLTAGEAMPFYGEITTFTFANGDELHARGGSAVLPLENPDPVYNAQFSNSFAIVGGTGRFEGARGGGTTNSLVTFGVGTDHKISGVIVLEKQRGNRH